MRYSQICFLLLLTVVSADETAFEWSFLPVEKWVHNADPTARVFEDRLYVYTSWDHKFACGTSSTSKSKKRGNQGFCMVGYRAYSTNDASLRTGWVAHGPVLIEENIPWVYKGGAQWSASATMWAPDVVRGNDGKYYMFFPAPNQKNQFRTGVAVADSPKGPFIPRKYPIAGTFGIDPNVIKLPNGKWKLFTSSYQIYVQDLDTTFWKVSEREEIKGLASGYKEGPFADIRNNNLILYYARIATGGYRIMQAMAKDPTDPAKGSLYSNVAIGSFDHQTNHGSVVTFRGRSWAFYHRHINKDNEQWKYRRVVFSPVFFLPNGEMSSIFPRF